MSALRCRTKRQIPLRQSTHLLALWRLLERREEHSHLLRFSKQSKIALSLTINGQGVMRNSDLLWSGTNEHIVRHKR